MNLRAAILAAIAVPGPHVFGVWAWLSVQADRQSMMQCKTLEVLMARAA
jgi:hypothetical protein